MFAFGLLVATFGLWYWGAEAIPHLGYTLTLREAQGMTLCSYQVDADVKDDRVPKVIETVRCLSCGKECNPHGKPMASCMQLTTTFYVTYPSTGLNRNESYPVACVCINRHPKKGSYEQFPECLTSQGPTQVRRVRGRLKFGKLREIIETELGKS